MDISIKTNRICDDKDAIIKGETPISKIIKALGINIKDLEAKTNIARTTFINYVNNRTLPTPRAAIRFVKYFNSLGLNVTLNHIYGLDCIDEMLEKYNERMQR